MPFCFAARLLRTQLKSPSVTARKINNHWPKCSLAAGSSRQAVRNIPKLALGVAFGRLMEVNSLFSSVVVTDLSSCEVSRERAVKNAVRISGASLQFSKTDALQQSVTRTFLFFTSTATKSTILGVTRGRTFFCSFSEDLVRMAGRCLQRHGGQS